MESIMSPEIIIWCGTFLTIFFFIIGLPIMLCIALWVVLITASTGDINALLNIGQTAYYGLASFALLAMPLFILTGDFISASGLARAFTNFGRSVAGGAKGALANSTLVASGLFSAISGSNAATTATIGSMMLPEFKKEKYDVVFAAATCASGGTVGIIIPPSVIFIVYGVLLNVPVGDLFLAGVIPGIMMVVSMMLVATYISTKNKWGIVSTFSFKAMLKAAWGAKHGFIASFITLGGIYTGAFSPTEAAGIAVAYCAFTGFVFTRKIPVRDTFKVIGKSAAINGILAPIIAFSVILQQQFSMLGVGEIIQGFLLGIGSDTQVIALMMIIIFAAGCILESLPNVIIFAPILAPIAMKIGFNPIHFGVIFVMGLAIGFITPPYGLNLFVASGISGISYTKIAKKIIYYIIPLVLVWISVAMFPKLALIFVSDAVMNTL